MLSLIRIFFKDPTLLYHLFTDGKPNVVFEEKKTQCFLTRLYYFILSSGLGSSNTCYSSQPVPPSNHFPPSSFHVLDRFCISENDIHSCIYGHLSYISLFYNLYLSNRNIWFFSTYHNLGWWGHFVDCQYFNLRSILHFSNTC